MKGMRPRYYGDHPCTEKQAEEIDRGALIAWRMTPEEAREKGAFTMTDEQKRLRDVVARRVLGLPFDHEFTWEDD